jgi:hypothetical protein
VGQWLTTLEVLAAANTNKKLTTFGHFCAQRQQLNHRYGKRRFNGKSHFGTFSTGR